VEILNYLQDAAGSERERERESFIRNNLHNSRNLVFDLAVTHDRYGSSAQPHHNGLLTHPQDLDAPLHVAVHARRSTTTAINMLITVT
jgi:hypothetical protein